MERSEAVGMVADLGAHVGEFGDLFDERETNGERP